MRTKGATALKIIIPIVIFVRLLFLFTERGSILPRLQIDDLNDNAVHGDNSSHPPIQSSPRETALLPNTLLPSKEDQEFWKGAKCFYVEDLCHLSHRFFYRRPSGNETKHQPPFVIDNLQTLPQGYPRHSSVLPDIPYDVQCTTSPIAYHIILTSVFNQMCK